MTDEDGSTGRSAADGGAAQVLALHFHPSHPGGRGVAYGPPGSGLQDTERHRETLGLWMEMVQLLDGSPLLARDSFRDNHYGDHEWEYVLLSAPAWAALASVIRTWITRRANRRVVVYGDNGNKLLEVAGDATTAEIEILLRSRVAPRELGGRPAPDS